MGSIVLKKRWGFNSRLGEEKLGCFKNYKKFKGKEIAVGRRAVAVVVAKEEDNRP